MKSIRWTVIDRVLCHCQLLRLLESDMPHVFLAPGLDGSAGLSYVNLTALTGNAVDVGDHQSYIVLSGPE